VDANHDDYLEAEEFCTVLMSVVTSDVPQRVLAQIGISPRQIVVDIGTLMLMLFGLFLMIYLVIQTFTTGRGIAQVVQTVASAGSVLYVKSQGNADMAKEEARLEQWAKVRVIEEICTSLNLSNNAVQALKKQRLEDAPATAKKEKAAS
jgi:hypothetical protein